MNSQKIILVIQVPKLFLCFPYQFSKFLWLSCSKFPGLLKKGQKFLCMCSRTRENNKKQSGTNIVGHPVHTVSIICKA